ETKPLTWQFIGEEQRLYSEIEDQLNEIERLMNFYRFSLHQGNKKVSKIVLLGDNPYLENAKDLIEHRFQVKTIQMNMPKEEIGETSSAFIPALGLALKGGE